MPLSLCKHRYNMVSSRYCSQRNHLHFPSRISHTLRSFRKCFLMSTDPTLGESLRLSRIASVSSTLAKGTRSIQRKKLPPPSMSWQSERQPFDLYQRRWSLFLREPHEGFVCAGVLQRQPGYVRLSCCHKALGIIASVIGNWRTLTAGAVLATGLAKNCSER
jgi:hypothetical protein